MKSQFVLLSAVEGSALDTKVIKNHYVKAKNKERQQISLKQTGSLFFLFVLKGKNVREISGS